MTKFQESLLFGLIIFSLLYLAAHLLRDGGFRPGNDEAHYYFYAREVSQHGLGIIPPMIDKYFSNIKNQFYPPPTRIGYVVTTAAFLSWYKGYWVLSFFSFICFILFLLAHLHYCQRYFGGKVALLSATILSASPLLLAMSRRVLIDGALNLLLCLSVWLFLDYLVLRKKPAYVFFLMVFALSLMFKESSVVLVPFFILMGWCFPKGPQLGLKDFIYLVLSVLAGGLIIPGFMVGWERWLLAIDELFHLQHAVFVFNPYVSKFCAGPWYRYLLDLMLLSPLTFLLFIGYIFYLIPRIKDNFVTKYFLSYFMITYALMTPLQKNIRYVINLEMVVAVFSVLMIIELFRGVVPASRRDWCVVLATVLIFLFDYYQFIDIFVVNKLLDPISAQLLIFQGFIPHR